MQRILKTTALIFVLAFIVSLANTTVVSAKEIHGRVISSADNAGISSATIFLPLQNLSLSTDEAGKFSIKNQQADTVVITVSCLGYKAIFDMVIRAGDENVIKLIPSEFMLGDIQITANRYAKEGYKVSQPIAMISGEEINNRGSMTVPGALKQFPGVDVADAGPFRARPVIRGLYGNRILVLVDGERLNDFRESNNFAGVSLSLVDPNEIDRVEVVNGPTSVLYGSDAMGGVVNIITRRNEFTPTLKPVASYRGRYSTGNAESSNRFDLGFSSDRFSGAVSYQYREATKSYRPPDGWNETSEYAAYNPKFYDSLNSARGTNYTRDRLVNSEALINSYDGKFAYKIDDNNRLDLDLGFFDGKDIGYPGVPNVETPYFFFYPKHERKNISLSYTGKNLTPRMSRLDSRFTYQNISKEFLTDFMDGIAIPFGPPGSPVLYPETVLNSTDVTKLGWNFQELYHASNKTGIAFGFDLLREEIGGDNIERSRLENAGPTPIEMTDTSSSVPPNHWVSAGLFTSVETEVGKLQATIGARYDNFWVKTKQSDLYMDDENNPLPAEDEHYNAVNGSLGLVYPVSNHVNLVSNFGTAYRVPNVIERFYYGSASGRETRPNPDIKPERSWTTDFGVKGVHYDVNYSLIGFYSHYTDFIQFANFDSVAQGPGQYQQLWRSENFERVTIAGFEAMIETQLNNGIYGSLGFTYQYGTINSENDEPLFVSPIRTTTTLGYRHKSGVFGEFTVRRTEKQSRIPDVSYLDDIATREFTLLNASVGVKLWQRVSLTLSGQNLTDELYSEPFNARVPDNPIPEAGRHFILSLSSSL